jgi:hypothetical protein
MKFVKILVITSTHDIRKWLVQTQFLIYVQSGARNDRVLDLLIKSLF